MRETFIPKTFGPKHEALIATADAIMRKAAREGYELSLRSIYYQFVAHYAHLLNSDPKKANSEQSYKMLGGVISEARDAGLLDWSLMKDKGRSTVQWAKYRDPAHLISSSKYRYAVDMWDAQRWHVELMVEKQALEGVLQPVASRFQVPFSANKGYSSSTAFYDVGRRLRDKRREGKRVAVIYFGDHDPSGLDMSRDVEERLALYSRGDLECVRVALNMNQIEQYEPPPNPTKVTDSRANGYIDQFGMECWELDALDYTVMANLANAAIKRYINLDQWNDDKKREAVDMAKIDLLIEKYEGGDLDEVLGDVDIDDTDVDELTEDDNEQNI